MILAPLTRHLAVCSLAEVQRFLDMDKNFWHVISIRDTTRPKLHLTGARSVQPFYFDDAELVEEGSKWIVLSEAQARDIWRLVDGQPEQPLLIHCVAGLSRSTAVAAAIIVRALMEAGMKMAEIPAEAAERLLTIRPPACPNGLVLIRLLEQIMPSGQAREITRGIWEDDRIMHNRFVRLH